MVEARPCAGAQPEASPASAGSAAVFFGELGMSRGADSEAVASPCTSLCVVDPGSGLCCGCFRTLDEISGWIDFSPSEKRSVIAALDARRTKFGAATLSRLEHRAER
jgi:uncharacterized protein